MCMMLTEHNLQNSDQQEQEKAAFLEAASRILGCTALGAHEGGCECVLSFQWE